MSYHPIIVIDNSFPQHMPFGFRNNEISKILECDKSNIAYAIPVTKSDNVATSVTGGGIGCSQQDFKHNLQGYIKKYPHLAKQIKFLPETMDSNTVGVAYLYFLVNTYTMLPYLNKNRIPFVFTLYPGGGFGLNNKTTNKMLQAIMQSPYFRGVIVTQHVIKDYLIDNKFCSPDKIHFEFGGFSQFSDEDMGIKKFYKKDKNTIDICFVAAKYSTQGKDKGYDIFIDVARQLVKQYKFVKFHVIGNFDEYDYDISGLENNITFYGLKTPDFLRGFYTNMDICVALSRKNVLLKGGFDGFPLGLESMFFQTTLITTDELNNNQATYMDGQELVIAKPTKQDLFKKIENLIKNPELLYKIGKSGFIKTNKIMNPNQRSKDIIAYLQKETKLKVSIICITYNHKKYIRDCLDGFVMQKTNFPFEVLIHDDASNDGTADIIREYAEKYPDIIKPILQTENQWSKGVSVDKTFNWSRISGKYVAMCEGDDYWTDPNKLQKQVDFLESHPDYSVCFHPVRVMWEDGRQPDYIFPTKKYRFHKNTLLLSDLLDHNFIQTNSVMYRWRKDCIDLFPDNILPGDWYMHLLHAQVGKIGFVPDVMGVYRRNAGGIWTGAFQDDKWFLKCTLPYLKFFVCAEKQFNYNYRKNMIGLMSLAVADFLQYHHFEELQQIQNLYPQIYNEVISCLKDQKNIELNKKRARKYKHLFNIILPISIIELIIVGIIIGVLL